MRRVRQGILIIEKQKFIPNPRNYLTCNALHGRMLHVAGFSAVNRLTVNLV